MAMRDFDGLTFHPATEKVVDILCMKVQNDNPEFFRVVFTYYLAKLAATMHVKVATKDRGEIPINLYAINLAESGHGKNFSENLIEEQIIHKFRNIFYEETYPCIVEESLSKLAIKKANIHNIDEEKALDIVKSEFNDAGVLAFSFDSATPEAIKQLRHKLLMCGIGAVNLEIDEIGSNLLGCKEALNTFIQLFDVGKIKQKLTKNTKDNVRSEEILGRTPANLLMFGTPTKLFDASKVEDEFYSFLKTGYARRCIFGFSKEVKKNKMLTPEEIYNSLVDQNTDNYLKDMAIKLGKLAHVTNHNKVIIAPKKVSMLMIEYKQHCEYLASQMSEYQEIAKAELSHRYFKTLKIAGLYAFIDGDAEISIDNFYHAICMAEESGRAFSKILARDRAFVKLAKYLGSIGYEVTHAELTEDLPFYKGSAAAKQECVQMAAAWGYKNHVIIKKSTVNGIEFLSGETLKKTDLKRMQLSYSSDISDGYKNVQASWEHLYKLTQQPFKHWINHHSTNGHREEDSMVPGFDMVVLDIDEGATVQEAMLLLKEYDFLIHTTKRHTNLKHRFRVIMPLNYHLSLSAEEYRKFMLNVYDWFPLDVDKTTCQRSRKWLTYKGLHHYNKGGKLLDARLFIPKTSKSDEQKTFINTYQSMTNMERWFVNGSNSGNRNNQLSRYAFVLVDMGYTFDVIKEHVLSMNDKLIDKLPIKEILNTIMVSVAHRLKKKSA